MTQTFKGRVLLAFTFAAAFMLHPATLQRARGETQVFSAPKGAAENVRVELGTGGVVHVTYDLVSDDPTAVFEVTVEVSRDGGKTFDLKPVRVGGDIGKMITPGPGKKINWDAGKEVETVQVDQLRFRIIPTAFRGKPKSTAALRITSTPAGANVFVNDDDRGRTPVNLEDLAPGVYRIRLVRDGFLENARQVTITDREQAVDVTLTPARSSAQANKSGTPKWLFIGGGVAAVAGAAAALGGGGSGDPQPPTPCSYSLNPTTHSASAIGGAFTVTVTTAAGCTWSTSGLPAWITTPNGSGTGTGTISFTVQANPVTARTATLTIAGLTFAVDQAAGQSCEFEVTSPVVFNFGASGGSGTGSWVVRSGTNCSWTARPVVSGVDNWVIVQDTGGTGNITVRFNVGPNSTGSAREGRIEVRWSGPQEGENIRILQSGT